MLFHRGSQVTRQSFNVAKYTVVCTLFDRQADTLLSPKLDLDCAFHHMHICTNILTNMVLQHSLYNLQLFQLFKILTDTGAKEFPIQTDSTVCLSVWC